MKGFEGYDFGECAKARLLPGVCESCPLRAAVISYNLQVMSYPD